MSVVADSLKMKERKQMESYSVRVWIANENDRENQIMLKMKSWESAIAFVQRFNADEMNKEAKLFAYVEAE
jgi:hypothetical protein